MEKICKTCLNKGTPICQLCSFVKSPSGKETKPSCYTGDGSAALAGMTVSDMGAVLLVRLQTGKPLPLSWVLRYNDRIVASLEN